MLKRGFLSEGEEFRHFKLELLLLHVHRTQLEGLGDLVHTFWPCLAGRRLRPRPGWRGYSPLYVNLLEVTATDLTAPWIWTLIKLTSNLNDIMGSMESLVWYFCEILDVFVGADSRSRPRLLDCQERRSSVERWTPLVELVLRFRLAWELRSERAPAEKKWSNRTEVIS